MTNAAVEIVEVDSVLLAATAARVKREDIPSAMGACFGRVYDWVQSSGQQQVGHNHAIYDQFTSEGMRMRVGFPVLAPFDDDGDINCVELPAGRAAHLRHSGDYSLSCKYCSMACSPGDLPARLRRAQFGRAEGFHVSSVPNGAAPETYRHDYGVPNTGTPRAFM